MIDSSTIFYQNRSRAGAAVREIRVEVVTEPFGDKFPDKVTVQDPLKGGFKKLARLSNGKASESCSRSSPAGHPG